MTTGFKLGLIGHDIAGVSSVQNRFGQDGEQLDLDVAWYLESLVDAKAVRDQVLGYAEPGTEPVLPLVWDEDETRSGYYRLTGASVDTDRRLLNSNKAQASLRLDRIHGYNAAAVESTYHGAVRSFAASFDGDVRPWAATPSTWGAFEFTGADGTDITPLDARVIDSTSGLEMLTWDSETAFFDGQLLQTAPPEAFYDGAVLLKMGETEAVITGHQATDPTTWCIDNGLIRVCSPRRSSSHFDLIARKPDGSGWTTRERGYRIILGTVPVPWPLDGVRPPERVNIVRNTPEAVTLCLALGSATSIGLTRMYLTVRRGSRFVSVSIAARVARPWGLKHDAGWTGSGATFTNAGGSTAIGRKEPADDPDGLRSIILQGTDTATPAGDGSARVTGDTLVELGVGAIESSDDEATASQWLAAQTETMQVVAQ